MNVYLKLIVVAAIIAVTITGCNNKKPQQTGIITATEEKGDVTKKGPEVTGSVNIKVNIEALANEKNTTVELPLPDKKSLKLVRKRLDTFEKGRFAWYGIIENDPGSFALLSITPKAISGKITTAKGIIYTINYAGKGIHNLDQINGSALPERKDDDIEVPAKPGDDQREGDCPDPATQVDVMVVYTADAQAGAGGAEGMEAFVYLCIYFTNLSYQNSNVNLAMHLVHHERVTYTETGNENTDLTMLQGTADGQMDNVHALRNAHGADLVSMITETMGGCGLANRQFPVTAGFESSAFSVVKRTCAAAGLSFAHETAHNMGARHDCANALTGGVPSAGANHGHVVSAPADGSGSSWRTVLAYNVCTGGPCTRIPYFSNPLLVFSPTAAAATDPMGTAAAAGVCTNDNTTVLNNAAAIVANFRCSSPGVANVWMRDTWDDTGLQPDPATAGQSMWRSPYIWIRNSAQDPTFQHQHEHENPKIGIPNWIYVKMHNGGVADNGT
ncbi:MAG: M12 family metallo-peptidase, partial [Chitinophagaceae bacterium]